MPASIHLGKGQAVSAARYGTKLFFLHRRLRIAGEGDNRVGYGTGFYRPLIAVLQKLLFLL
jgi:hypothetical protein